MLKALVCDSLAHAVSLLLAADPYDIVAEVKEMIMAHLEGDGTIPLIVEQATIGSMKVSSAFQLVSDSGKIGDAICAITMVDTLVDSKIPLLRKRLLRTDPDIANDMPNVGHGYVAVKNRSKKDQTIGDAAVEEEDWFKQHLPDLLTTNGCSYLVKKMSIAFVKCVWRICCCAKQPRVLAAPALINSLLPCRHTKEKWVPSALIKLKEARQRVKDELEPLGTPVSVNLEQSRELMDEVLSVWEDCLRKAGEAEHWTDVKNHINALGGAEVEERDDYLCVFGDVKLAVDSTNQFELMNFLRLNTDILRARLPALVNELFVGEPDGEPMILAAFDAAFDEHGDEQPWELQEHFVCNFIQVVNSFKQSCGENCAR